MTPGPSRRERVGQRGAVVVEIVLSLPFLALIFGITFYLATTMRHRIATEEALQRAVRICAQGFVEFDALAVGDGAEQCIRDQLENRLEFCVPAPTIEAEYVVGDWSRTYTEDDAIAAGFTIDEAEDEDFADRGRLVNPVEKALALLRGKVTCKMSTSAGRLPVVEEQIETEVAMPIRRALTD